MTVDSDLLLKRVAEICGFSEFVGPGAIRRALAAHGADPKTATPEHYRRALPELQARLQVYLSEDEATKRIREITTLLDKLDGNAGQKDDWKGDETLFGKRRFGRSIEILREVRAQLRSVTGDENEPSTSSNPPPPSSRRPKSE